jgi:RHS repeat-associated protein
MYYVADVYTGVVISPFGSAISEMQFKSDTGGGYRYGFNNQEMDEELGEYYAFEYRIHDARLGRFLSVDPLASSYPWNSTYAFACNSVIMNIDLEGREKADAVQFQYANSIINGYKSKLSSGLIKDKTLIYDLTLSRLLELMQSQIINKDLLSRVGKADDFSSGYFCGSAAVGTVIMNYNPVGYVSAVIQLALNGFAFNHNEKIYLADFLKNESLWLSYDKGYFSYEGNVSAPDAILNFSIRSTENDYSSKKLDNERAAGTLPWEIDNLFNYMGISIEKQSVYGGQSIKDINIIQEAIAQGKLPIIFENHLLTSSTSTKDNGYGGLFGIHFIVIHEISVCNNQVTFLYSENGKIQDLTIRSVEDFLKGMKAYYIPSFNSNSTSVSNSGNSNLNRGGSGMGQLHFDDLNNSNL